MVGDTVYGGIPIWNIQTVNVTSKVVNTFYCQQLCKDTKFCNFYTFKARTKDCQLFYSKGKVRENRGSYSGPKRCPDNKAVCFEANKAYYDNVAIGSEDITKDFGRLNSAKDCQNKCKQQYEYKNWCVWFAFSNFKLCYLYSSRSNSQTAKKGYISGPPSCAKKNTTLPILSKPDENCIETNVGYAGFPIIYEGKEKGLSFKNTTIEECRQQCQLVPECKWFNHISSKCYLKYMKGFKYYTPGVKSGPSSCGYKDPHQNKLTIDCIESGGMYSGLPLWNTEGGDISMYYKEGDTPKKCQEICSKNAGCVWFNFDYQLRCSLLSWRKEESPIPKLGHWNGPPSCPKKKYTAPALLVEDCLHQNIQFVGYPLLNSTTQSNLYPQVDTPKECREKCMKLRNCKWITYRSANTTCWLHAQEGFKEYLEGYQGGRGNRKC